MSSGRPLKVLLVGPLPLPYGGIARYVNDLLTNGVSGVSYSVFNTSLPDWVAPPEREGAMSYGSLGESGFSVAARKVAYVLASFSRLFIRLLGDRPRIVHVFTCSYWGYWRSYIYLRIARLCGRKTVFHLLNAIDIFYSRAGRLQRFLIRHSLNTEDLYLVQSPGLRDWLEKLTRRDVVSLWNGIDFAAIPERADAKAEPDPKHLVGITVGALGQNKGTPDLLRAIQLLRARGLEVSWVFVGRGDLAKFRAMARAEGIFDSVVFTGTVSDAEKWRLLQQAHFFCLPSYAEGQPISVIEAMAVGLPVISTPVGSIPEVVTDENGILVSPGDVEGLCSAVARLTQEPGLRNSMGEASARLARERHDMRSVFAGIRKAYCGLVAAN